MHPLSRHGGPGGIPWPISVGAVRRHAATGRDRQGAGGRAAHAAAGRAFFLGGRTDPPRAARLDSGSLGPDRADRPAGDARCRGGRLSFRSHRAADATPSPGGGSFRQRAAAATASSRVARGPAFPPASARTADALAGDQMNAPRALAGHRALSVLPGVFFIAGWVMLLEIAARNGWINRTFSPVPSQIASHLHGVVTSSAFLDALGSTIGLLAAGYFLACAGGIFLGIAMGYNRRIYSLLEPVLELLRPIPKPALLPPLILLFGLGASMKIAIVFLGAVFPVLINTIQGVRTVDPVLVDVARTFRRGTLKTMFRVVLPASLPMILSGM